MALARKLLIALSPLVAIDRERCILCYRCVRFSQEIAEDYQLIFTERAAQLEAILEIGAVLDRVVRHASIGVLVRLARAPAHAAGLAALHDFLERGFDAFRAAGGAAEFLAIVREREFDLIERLYSGAADPFREIF